MACALVVGKPDRDEAHRFFEAPARRSIAANGSNVRGGARTATASGTGTAPSEMLRQTLQPARTQQRAIAGGRKKPHSSAGPNAGRGKGNAC
jgi:hypothetical protein